MDDRAGSEVPELLDTWFTAAARLPAPRLPMQRIDAAQVAAVLDDAARQCLRSGAQTASDRRTGTRTLAQRLRSGSGD